MLSLASQCLMCDTGFTYYTVKTICVGILLIQLQSPMVSVGNTIRTQMFHNESTRSKRINQLKKTLTAEHLKDTT